MFIDYISDNFEKLKETFRCRITRIGLSFNEDIFSDTIIKCNNKLSGRTLTDKDIICYFWTAFKLNTIRDLSYLRNNTTNIFPQIEDSVIDFDNELFDEVSNLIITKFGNELYTLFALHANGTKYSDLYKLTNETNLKYLFRKIREYVRGVYKKKEGR